MDRGTIAIASVGLLAIAVVLLTGHLARQKGRSANVWLLLGLFGGPISLLVLWSLPKAVSRGSPAHEPEASSSIPDFNLGPSMPHMASSTPVNDFMHGLSRIVVYKSPPSIFEAMTGEQGPINYLWAAAQFIPAKRRLVQIFTLESGMGQGTFFCAFDASGAHRNLGSGRGLEEQSAFESAVRGSVVVPAAASSTEQSSDEASASTRKSDASRKVVASFAVVALSMIVGVIVLAVRHEPHRAVTQESKPDALPSSPTVVPSVESSTTSGIKALGIATYVNSRFGFAFQYPASLLHGRGESENGDGQEFFSEDRSFHLIAWAERSVSSPNLNALLEDTSRDLVVTYQHRSKDWLVVSGTRGEESVYKRIHATPTHVAHVEMAWPSSQTDRWRSLIEQVSRSHKVRSGAQ
jgi:hypothetical protein